jgi:hypothetical protein
VTGKHALLGPRTAADTISFPPQTSVFSQPGDPPRVPLTSHSFMALAPAAPSAPAAAVGDAGVGGAPPAVDLLLLPPGAAELRGEAGGAPRRCVSAVRQVALMWA